MDPQAEEACFFIGKKTPSPADGAYLIRIVFLRKDEAQRLIRKLE